MALALKLTYFVLERAAEPISARLEGAAANSAVFRSACTRLAQAYNKIDYNKQLRRAALEQRLADLHPEPGRSQWVPMDDIEPPPVLSEKEATQRGCDLLGEAFVIAVGLSLLLHQQMADREAEAANLATVEANELRIRHLEASEAVLRASQAALEDKLASLERAQAEVRRRQRSPLWKYIGFGAPAEHMEER